MNAKRYSIEIAVSEVNEWGEVEDTHDVTGPMFAVSDKAAAVWIAETLSQSADGWFSHWAESTPLVIAAPVEGEPAEFEGEPTEEELEAAGLVVKLFCPQCGKGNFINIGAYEDGSQFYCMNCGSSEPMASLLELEAAGAIVHV